MTYQSSFCKPEFWFRPVQFIRRRLANTGTGEKFGVHLPWGLEITVQPRDTIGRQVQVFGVFELGVSEAAWRLIDPGDTVLDVGANLGYMAGLFACRTGSTGVVHAFEPHPMVFEMLREHVARWTGAPGAGPIRLHAVAAADREGMALLHDEGESADNCGLGSLVHAPGNGRSFEVTLVRLDDQECTRGPVGLLKVDVEGAEEWVLRGLTATLERGGIRDILFEDQGEDPTPIYRLLEERGYRLFSLGVDFLGPHLCPLAKGRAPMRRWDSPNTLATRDPDRAVARLAARGWRCLRGGL